MLTLMIAVDFIEFSSEHHYVEFMRNHCIADSTPVVAVGMTRDKNHSDFVGIAGYGYCAAKKLFYYGFKLVML